MSPWPLVQTLFFQFCGTRSSQSFTWSHLDVWTSELQATSGSAPVVSQLAVSSFHWVKESVGSENIFFFFLMTSCQCLEIDFFERKTLPLSVLQMTFIFISPYRFIVLQLCAASWLHGCANIDGMELFQPKHYIVSSSRSHQSPTSPSVFQQPAARNLEGTLSDQKTNPVVYFGFYQWRSFVSIKPLQRFKLVKQIVICEVSLHCLQAVEEKSISLHHPGFLGSHPNVFPVPD